MNLLVLLREFKYSFNFLGTKLVFYIRTQYVQRSKNHHFGYKKKPIC
jgi:hypothetical protein